MASTEECDYEQTVKINICCVIPDQSEEFLTSVSRAFTTTASTSAAEVTEIWQMLYTTWKRYAIFPLLNSCFEIA